MTDANEMTDDEKLSAFLDGELPDAAAAELARRLEQEPGLAARLEMLEAGNTEARRLFAAVDNAPMPQAVLDRIAAHQAPADSNNVIAFPARGLRQLFSAPVAIAASVALVAGFLIGDQYRGAGGSDTLAPGVVASGSGLHRLLETGASGEPVELGNGVEGRVLLTFEDRRGDYCRQLSTAAGATAAQGIACRRQGDWQIEAAGLAEAAPGGQFQQARGNTPAAVDAAIERLMGDAPALDAEEEKAVISNTWKKSGH